MIFFSTILSVLIKNYFFSYIAPPPPAVVTQTSDGFGLHGFHSTGPFRRPSSPGSTELGDEIINGRIDFGPSRHFPRTPRPHIHPDREDYEYDSDPTHRPGTQVRPPKPPKPDLQPTKLIDEGTQSEDKSTRNVGTMHEPVETRNFGNEVQPQSSSTQTSFPLKQPQKPPKKTFFTYIERPDHTERLIDDSYPDQRISPQPHDIYYERYETIPHDRSKRRSPSPQIIDYPSDRQQPYYDIQYEDRQPEICRRRSPSPQIIDYPCDRQQPYYDTEFKDHEPEICHRRSPSSPVIYHSMPRPPPDHEPEIRHRRSPSPPPVKYRSMPRLSPDHEPEIHHRRSASRSPVIYHSMPRPPPDHEREIRHRRSPSSSPVIYRSVPRPPPDHEPEIRHRRSPSPPPVIYRSMPRLSPDHQPETRRRRSPSPPPVAYRSMVRLPPGHPPITIYRPYTPTLPRRSRGSSAPHRRPHSAAPRYRPQMYSQETDTSLDAMKRKQHMGVQYEPRSTKEKGTSLSYRLKQPTTSHRTIDASMYSQERYRSPHSSLPRHRDHSPKQYYIQPTTDDYYRQEEEEEDEEEEKAPSMHDQSTMAELLVSLDHYTQCESQPYMADHYVQTTPTLDEDDQNLLEESYIRQLPSRGSISIPQPVIIQPDSLPRTRRSQHSSTRRKRDGLDYTGKILEVSLHHGQQQRTTSMRESPLLNIGTEHFIQQTPTNEYTVPFETRYVYDSTRSSTLRSRSSNSINAPNRNSPRTHLFTNSPIHQSRSNGNFYLSSGPPRSLRSSFRLDVTTD